MKIIFSICILTILSCCTTKQNTIFNTGIAGDKKANGCVTKIFGMVVGADTDWKKIAKDSNIIIPTSAKIETTSFGSAYQSICINVEGRDANINIAGKNIDLSGIKKLL